MVRTAPEASSFSLVTTFKGVGSPDEYFFTAYKIKSVLSVHAQMVLKFFACLAQE
jgi:hypothetical protein